LLIRSLFAKLHPALSIFTVHGRILTVVPNLLWFTLVYQELFFTYRTRLPRQQYVFPWFFERELRLAVWANSDLVGDDHPEKIVPRWTNPNHTRVTVSECRKRGMAMTRSCNSRL
jgi:hypothetical protein